MQNLLAHDFSRREFHGGARRDDHVNFRFVRITPEAGLGQPDFEDAEISQFDIIARREAFGDAVKGLLNDGEGLLLGDADSLADFDDHIAFGEVGHIRDGLMRLIRYCHVIWITMHKSKKYEPFWVLWNIFELLAPMTFVQY